jgi:hypothetical protein
MGESRGVGTHAGSTAQLGRTEPIVSDVGAWGVESDKWLSHVGSEHMQGRRLNWDASARSGRTKPIVSDVGAWGVESDVRLTWLVDRLAGLGDRSMSPSP